MTIYLLNTTKRGVSTRHIAKWVGVHQQTAWFMMHRIREAYKEENNILLLGEVESDETFVGPDINRDTRLQREQKEHNEEQDRIHGITKQKARRKRGFPAKRGRKKGYTKEVLEQIRKEKEARGQRKPFDKCTVVVGFSEKRGRIALKKLGDSKSDLNKEKVSKELFNCVSIKSVLFTDEASIYFEAGTQFADHKSVNHKETYVKDGVHINNIENVWNHFKRTVDGTYFHFSKQHFNRYLDEYTYRWNRRDETEKSIFESFFPLAIGKRLSYLTLIKDSPTKKKRAA